MAHYMQNKWGSKELTLDFETLIEGMVGYLVIKKQYLTKLKEWYPTVEDRQLRDQLEVLALTGKLYATSVFPDGHFTDCEENPGAMDTRFKVCTFLHDSEAFMPPDDGFSMFNRQPEVERDVSVLKLASKKSLSSLKLFEEELVQMLPHVEDEGYWDRVMWWRTLLGYDPLKLLAYVKDLVKHGQCQFEQFVSDILISRGVKCVSGLVRGFRTKLRETLALAKRKVAQRISAAELKFMQALPLDIKIAKSLLRIKEWYEYWQGVVHISASAGKDSTVLTHLVRSVYPDVPCVHVRTGQEHPLITAFAKKIPNIIFLRPKMTFEQVVMRYGYPVVSKAQASTINKLTCNNLTPAYRSKLLHGDALGNAGKLSAKWHYLLDAPFKISDHCCFVLKKQPLFEYERLTGSKPFVGTIAQESRNRTMRYLESGCNSFDRAAPTSTPLGFWTEQDVLEYLRRFNVPISKAYGDIVVGADGKLTTTKEKRTGCVACSFGIHLERGGENRIQRLARDYPKWYRYFMEKLGMDIVLNHLNVDFMPVTA